MIGNLRVNFHVLLSRQSFIQMIHYSIDTLLQCCPSGIGCGHFYDFFTKRVGLGCEKNVMWQINYRFILHNSAAYYRLRADILAVRKVVNAHLSRWQLKQYNPLFWSGDRMMRALHFPTGFPSSTSHTGHFVRYRKWLCVKNILSNT
jgi:hypothetical protein